VREDTISGVPVSVVAGAEVRVAASLATLSDGRARVVGTRDASAGLASFPEVLEISEHLCERL
jgi:hypothetical protein